MEEFFFLDLPLFLRKWAEYVASLVVNAGVASSGGEARSLTLGAEVEVPVPGSIPDHIISHPSTTISFNFILFA